MNCIISSLQSLWLLDTVPRSARLQCAKKVAWWHSARDGRHGRLQRERGQKIASTRHKDMWICAAALCQGKCKKACRKRSQRSRLRPQLSVRPLHEAHAAIGIAPSSEFGTAKRTFFCCKPWKSLKQGWSYAGYCEFLLSMKREGL